MNNGPVIRIDKVYYRTGRWPFYTDWLVGFDYYADNVRFVLPGDVLTGNPYRDYNWIKSLTELDGRPFSNKRLIKVKPGMRFKRKWKKTSSPGISTSYLTTAAHITHTASHP